MAQNGTFASSPLPSQKWQTFLQFSFGSVMFVGLPANTFIIGLFSRYSCLQTFPNLLLVSLSVGDLLVTSILCPLTILQVQGSENLLISKLAGYLSALIAISGYTLISISYYRFVKITRSYFRGHNTIKKIALLVIPWGSPMLYAVTKRINVILNDLVVIISIPICFTIVWYYCRRIKKVLLQQSESSNDEISKKSSARNKKTMAVINLIVLVAMATSSGMPVFRLFKFMSENVIPGGWVWFDASLTSFIVFGRLIWCINSVINPFIYFFKHPAFYRCARKTVSRFIKKRNSQVDSSV